MKPAATELLSAILTLLFFAVLAVGVLCMLTGKIGVSAWNLVVAIFWLPFGRPGKGAL